jgi:hypothetical protein
MVLSRSLEETPYSIMRRIQATSSGGSDAYRLRGQVDHSATISKARFSGLCPRTRPSFLLIPAGRRHRPLFMVLMGLSADPLAKNWSAIEAIAIQWLWPGAKMEIPVK